MTPFLLTFDIEEYFQVENLRPAFPIENWGSVQSRVSIGVDCILDLLQERGIHATFFVLGWVAERHPELVREILRRGHEIACHGFGHQLLSGMGDIAIRNDLVRAKRVLEDLTGSPVIGFRSPNFTIVPNLYSILKEVGFVYDSSLFPFRIHDRYGKLDEASLQNVGGGVFRDEASGIMEIPIPMLHAGGLRFPWAGGAYFRLIPSFLYMAGVERILAHSSYFLFYLHSWEFDHEQPRIKNNIRFTHFLRHYIGLGSVKGKFQSLLNRPRNFMTACEFLGTKKD